MKIVVSGWAGSGSSSLAMILARMFEINLFKGSEAFRVLWDKLGYGQTGEAIIKGENTIEPYFGPLYDEYIDHSLLKSELNFVLESDIAAFRLGKRPEFFSLFLTPSIESRKRRLEADKRSEDVEFLENRDRQHQEIYKKLTGFDFLSLEDINKKYDLVLDTSDISIANELKIILDEFRNRNLIDSERYNSLFSQVELEEENFYRFGKSKIIKDLESKGSVIGGEKIIKEIVSLYKDKIAEFPTDLKNAILSV